MSAQYDIPKRVLYKAARQQQVKQNKQKAYLIATPAFAASYNVEMELASFSNNFCINLRTTRWNKYARSRSKL